MSEPTGLAGLPYIDGKKTIGDLTMAVADARYVNADGDTMTGDLLLSGAALASAFSTSPLTLRGGGSGADIFRLNSWNNSRILTVNLSGQFGINTDSPGAMLDVAGASGIVVRSVQGSARVLELSVSGVVATIREAGGLTADEFRVMQTALGILTLHTNAAERVRITDVGRVVVGFAAIGGTSDVLAQLFVGADQGAAGADIVRFFAKNAAFDANVITGGTQRAGSSAFSLLSLRAGMNADGSGGTNVFRVTGDGHAVLLGDGVAEIGTKIYVGTILTGGPDDEGAVRLFARPQALTDPGGIEFQIAPSYGQRIVAFDNTSSPALVFANRSASATWTEYLRLMSARAVLESTGVIGNTAAIFGAGGRGIALVRDDAYVGFNAYYNGGWKAMVTGAAALIGSAGEELQFYLGSSANIDAALTMTSYLTLIPTAFYPTNTSVTELGKSDKLWEIIWGSRLYLGNAATDFNLIMERYSTGVGTGPGASKGVLRWEPGTNAGTLKLVAYSGTSTTGVTIVDNVGSGN